MSVRESRLAQLHSKRRLPVFVAACWLLLVTVFAAMPSRGQVHNDASSSSVELKEGQTPEEVEKILGKPDDITRVKDDLIYTYPTLRVYFEHGKLVNVEERAARTAQKKQSKGSQEGAQAAEVLTNSDVLKMVQVKLGDVIIIGKIRTSPCNFDTTVDALVKLKEAGVSDPVIQAMVNVGERKPAQVPSDQEQAPALASLERTWFGWITDTKCGAKGANAAHLDCANMCVQHGEQYALYDSAGQWLYVLVPQDLAASHVAQRVKVRGRLEGDTITIVAINEKGYEQ